jgi:hypothetical protein
VKLPSLKQVAEDLKPRDAFEWATLCLTLYFIYLGIFK